MSLKVLLRLSLVVAFVVGAGLIGCSDGTQRVSVTGSNDSIDQLATGLDEAHDLNAYYDYIEDGYYYPEDETVDDILTDPGDHDWPSDDPSDKPIDNGLGDV
jgi:hypothetical protein